MQDLVIWKARQTSFEKFGEYCDVIVFSDVIATLEFAALLASFLPARRVTRIDPVVALAIE